MASSGWDCAKCTFINYQSTRFCGMCGSPRPDVMSSEPDKATIDVEKILGGLLNTNRTTGWACSRCTFENEGSRKYCKVCQSRKIEDISENIQQTFTQHDQVSQNGAKQVTADGVASNERRLVLIGKTGTGKSATGNSILGRREFESLVSGESITKACRRGEAKRFGKEIMVVDTPGLFDTDMTNEQVTREIVRCIGMTSPGPHAFILVVHIGRFTKEEQDTVKHFADSFGEGFYNYLMVLFTRKDDLVRQGISIEKYVTTVPKALKDILQKCNGRYAVIDNVAEDKESDVRVLMDLVEQMRLDNGRSCYTNEMYQEAEKTLKRRMDQLKKDMEEEKKRQIREITNVVTKEYQSKLDQETAEKLQYQEKLQVLEKENNKKQNALEDKLKRMQLEVKHQNEKFELEKENRRSMNKMEEDRLRREREEFAERKRQMDEDIKYNRKLAEKERIKNQRQQEDYERRLKEMEKREERLRKDMEKKIAERTDEVEEELRKKTDPKNLRKQARDECQEGQGILSKLWGGIKSVGRGLKNFFFGK